MKMILLNINLNSRDRRKLHMSFIMKMQITFFTETLEICRLLLRTIEIM